MKKQINKLDLVLEQYNEDNYPELAKQERTPPFDVIVYAPAVLGVEEKSLRIIFSYSKAIELHRMIYSCSIEDATAFLNDKIEKEGINEYRAIWSKLDGSFEDIWQTTFDKYEVLQDKPRCPDGLNDACIGFDEESLRMIYSQTKAIQILVDRDGMTWDEAQEYLEYNTFPYSSAEQYQPIWCDDEVLQNYSEDDPAVEESMYVAAFMEQSEDTELLTLMQGIEGAMDRLTIWESLDALYDYYEVPDIFRREEGEINGNKIEWKLGDFMPFKTLFIKRVALNG